MAFSIKQIKAKLQDYGVPAENLDSAAESICAMHKTDLDAIIEQRDTYKTDSETLEKVKKELDDLKAAGDGGLSVLQEKYNTLEKDHKRLVKEYDQYKADQDAKEMLSTKEKAFRAALKEVNISEKRMDTVVKAAHAEGVINGLDLDENGAIKEVDKLKESIKTEWADFVEYTTTKGAEISHPPAMAGGNKHTMTREEIMSIKDTAQRQNAMAQNLDLFGIK